jgi:hypothetical protein
MSTINSRYFVRPRFASRTLRCDAAVVSKAVRLDGWAIYFAARSLQEDENIAAAAMESRSVRVRIAKRSLALTDDSRRSDLRICEALNRAEDNGEHKSEFRERDSAPNSWSPLGASQEDSMLNSSGEGELPIRRNFGGLGASPRGTTFA